MAIQFARLEYVSRSQGKNACCKSAYNSRDKLVDERTGVIYNFSRLKDNAYHEVLLPANVNAKYKNLETLMNAIECTENRKNSQLLKEYVIALPDNDEISVEDRIELIKRFVAAKQFVAEGLGVQIDLHKPHNSEKNWHGHILTTTRRFREDGLGFGAKARDLDVTVKGGANHYVEKEQETLGVLWKNIQNTYFEEKGLNIKVDEIAKNPGVHLGPVRMRGIMNEVAQFYEDIKETQKEALKNGEALLDQVTKTQAIFTREYLKEVAEKIADTNSTAIVSEALTSDRVVALYNNDGQETNFFTTSEVRSEEERTVRIAERVYAKNTGKLNYQETKLQIQAMTTNKEISTHQAEALTKLLVTNGLQGLSVLRGRAGTGKSHVLGKLKTLTEGHYKVIGLAPTNKAKVGLTDAGYSDAYTIKKFLFLAKNNKITVNPNTLLVVDEAGMVDTPTYLELMKVIYSSGACPIFAGCNRQLTSYERGGMFPILADKYGVAELSETLRQQTAWGKDVAEAFAEGNVRAGVEVLAENMRLHFDDSLDEAMVHLLKDWAASRETLENRLIITIANKNVDALNFGAREILKELGVIYGSEYKIESTKTKGNFATGDRIIFIENNQRVGAINGEFGNIIEATLSKFKVKQDNGTIIEFNPHDVKFKHGYAATVYKSQGDSVRDVYVLHSGYSNLRNSYVKMSRHVNNLALYCNRLSTENQNVLIEQLSHRGNSDSSICYKTAHDLAIMRQAENQNALQKMGGWIKDRMNYLGDVLHSNADYYVFEKEPVGNSKVIEVITDINAKFQEKTGVNAEFAYQIKSADAKEQVQQESTINKIEATTTSTEKNQEEIKDNDLQAKSPTLKASNDENSDGWHDNIARARQDLKLAAERVSVSLLGEPNRNLSTKNTLRFGETGTLAVEVSGNKAGLWYDFAKSEGGDMLRLLQKELNIDFKEALVEAQKLINDKAIAEVDVIKEAALKNQVKELNSQDKTSKPLKLYEQSREISGVAKKYLTEFGISKAPADEIRMVDNLWHSNARENLSAIVAFAKDNQGKITGAEAIYLNQDGTKTDTAPEKKSFGNIQGSYVEIQRASVGITIIADSVENALSIKEADIPGKILCAIDADNFKNYPAMKGESIIICVEQDTQKTATKAINDAKTQLQAQGAEVSILKPQEASSFNEGLKEKGIAALQAEIMPCVEKKFDKNWLEVWENKTKYKINTEELLRDKNPERALNIQNQARQNTSKEINEFMVNNKEELENIKKFAPDYNIEEFKLGLQGLEQAQMRALLRDAKFTAFKDYALGEMEGIQQEKLKTKTIDELAAICEKEKAFCLNMDKHHGDLLFELKRDGYEHISIERARYRVQPTLIDDFRRDANNAIAFGVGKSKTESLFAQAKEISLYTAESRLFEVCKEHVTNKLNYELNHLKEYGHIKKDDIIYRTEKEYLRDSLADQTLAPYLKESKYERRFEELKQQELQLVQQQQRSQDRGDSR